MTFNLSADIGPRARASLGATRRGRQKAVATTGSTIVHLILASLLLGFDGGKMLAVDGAGVDQGTMAVTLVSASALRTPPPSQTGGRLSPLLAEVDNGQTPVYLPPPERAASSVADLMRRLQTAEPARHSPPAPAVQRAEHREGGDETDARAAGENASGKQAGAEAGGTGGLWGVVQPCWRKMGSQGRVPVTLEVSLDASGRLSTPPRIIRTDGVADEIHLRAEASALAALAVCMPRGDVRLGGRTYRLDFKPGR